MENQALSTPEKNDLKWNKILKTTPPSVTRADVEQQMMMDGMERFIYDGNNTGEPCSTEQAIVYFLYGTQFAFKDEKDKRVARVMRFLGTAGAEERMKYMITPEDMDHHAVTNPAELRSQWAYGQKAVLRYENQDNARTIFTEKNIPYTEIHQKSKSCYLHAVVAFLTNKVAFDSPTSNDFKARALGASTFIRHNLRGKRLELRMVENKGGSSRNVLEEIICQTLSSLQPREGDEDISARFLNRYGPALVSRFRVDSHFRSKKNQTPQNAGENCIHQFDIVDGDSEHKFFWLGESTEAERLVFRQIEDANGFSPNSDQKNDQKLASSASVPDDGESGESMDEAEADDMEETYGGLHAMIAIGHRFETDVSGKKKYWFLLQNTWKKMPLIEMSAKYLVNHLDRCGALQFHMGKLSSMPTSFNFCGGLIQEGSFDDGGEEDEEVEDDNLEDEDDDDDEDEDVEGEDVDDSDLEDAT